MMGNGYLKHLLGILVYLSFFIASAYSQSQPPIPPPQAVPEGNVITAFSLVGSGLYVLWLKGRKLR